MSKVKGSKGIHKDVTPKITANKYFQYHGSGVHPYTQAFVAERFRDIIKTKEEWDKLLIPQTEGNI